MAERTLSAEQVGRILYACDKIDAFLLLVRRGSLLSVDTASLYEAVGGVILIKDIVKGASEGRDSVSSVSRSDEMARIDNIRSILEADMPTYHDKLVAIEEALSITPAKVGGVILIKDIVQGEAP